MKTKFGNAKINHKGYYIITSRKECNHGKLLHRLIFEDFYGYIPKNYHVHHIDENKTNNCIMNLQLLHKSKHSSYHNSGENHHMFGKFGENHHMFGKHHSDEARAKISEAISKATNQTGYYRVSKHQDIKCKQGFLYCYQYYENNRRKRIQSVDINKLEKKVKEKNLEWRKI